MSATGAARRPQVRGDLAVRAGYHSPQIDVEVRLNTNEAPEPPPPEFCDALAAELSRIDWNRYPDRRATELCERLAAVHGVDAGQIFVANGSNEVIQTVLLAYAGAGRSVATFEPTFAMYGHIARITGAAVIEGRRADDFVIPDREIDRVLDREPAVVFLTSPNNPTGGIEPPEVVGRVAGATDGVVFVDEAYGQFADWSALELFDEERALVVSRTFSKTWSMAAARLGYLIGPTWLVEELWEVVLPYHLDAATQAAGRLALGFDHEMRDRVRRLVAERDRVTATLATLPLRQWPSDANFILFQPDNRGGDEVWQALVDRSVLVRNCSSWPHLDGCLRVTIGTPDENDRFLAALQEVLA